MPQYITVSTDYTGMKIFRIALEDVTFISKEAAVKGVHLHTLHETGYLPGSLEYWLSFLTAAGLNIEQYDRGTALNLSKVELIDKKTKIAYFEPIRRREKGCTIAIANFNSVIQALKDINKIFELV